jgi:hypothetical protein
MVMTAILTIAGGLAMPGGEIEQPLIHVDESVAPAQGLSEHDRGCVGERGGESK